MGAPVALIAAIFFCRAVFPAAHTVIAQSESMESISNRLDKVRKDIERARREIEKGEKNILDMGRRSKSVQSEMEKEERKIETVRRNLQRLENEEKILFREEEAALRRLDDAKRVLAVRSEEYRIRLRTMYLRQKISPARMLFSARSLSSLLRGFRMLKELAAADLEILHAMRRQNETIQTEMANIRIALEAKRALEISKRREGAYLANAQKKRREILLEIDRDRKRQEERNLKWEEDYRQAMALMDRLLEEQIARDKMVDPGALKNYNFVSRKGKLPWPVSGPVVSGFGRQVDAKTKTVTINRGIAFQTKQGEQIRAVGTGRVVKTQSIRGYGNFIMIHHYPTYYSIYAHLSNILVSEGDIILEGSVIGLAGSTGLVDHQQSRLLIEVLNGRIPENPFRWLRPDRRSAGS